MKTRWNKVVGMKKQLELMKLGCIKDILNLIHTKRNKNQVSRLVTKRVAAKRVRAKPLQKSSSKGQRRK